MQTTDKKAFNEYFQILQSIWCYCHLVIKKRLTHTCELIPDNFLTFKSVSVNLHHLWIAISYKKF